MDTVALFGLVGIGCLLAALVGNGVKLGHFEVPAIPSRIVRVGVAVVGVAALVIGIGLFVGRDNGTTSRPPAATSSVAPATQSTSTSVLAAESTTPPPTNHGPASVVWQGTVRLTDGNGVDLGSVPVKVEALASTSFWVYQGQVLTSQDGNNLMAEWTGSAAPTADDCANLLNTQPVEALDLHAGLQICAHGLFERRVGFAQISSYDGNVAQVSITVWSRTLPW